MSVKYECPFCLKILPDERAPCCGEVGHAQVHLHEWVTGNGFLECAGCGKEKLDPEYIP